MNLWLAVISVAIVVITARPRNSNELSKRQVNQNCGNLVFRANSGFISTPNYPGNYPDGTTCVYTVQPSNVSSQSYVDFYTCDCVLEDHSVCGFDYIRFGSNGTKECGDISSRLFSVMLTNGKAEVTFDTDGSVNFRGCKIGYGTPGNLPNCPTRNITASSTLQWWNATTPSYINSTSWWNATTPSYINSTSWWNATTTSFINLTSWWNATTPSFNFSTTAAPSNGSIYDLLNIMYGKAYAVEDAFEQYRHAVSNVINRLML